MKDKIRFVIVITLLISLSYCMYFYSVLSVEIKNNYDIAPLYYFSYLAKPAFYFSFGYLLFDTLVLKTKFYLSKRVSKVLTILVILSCLLYVYVLINKIYVNPSILSNSALFLCCGIVMNSIVDNRRDHQ